MVTARRALAYAAQNRPRFVEELKKFISIPSVSAQPRHAENVKRCARWLAEHLKSIGLERVRVEATPRHPIVSAEWKGAPGRPTLLIYGHYDVQPPDPLKKWRSSPFEPVIRGNNLLGRGASDDKGQLFTHVKALEAWLGTTGRLPVNVQCLFEGEEEIGSPNLEAFLRRNRTVLDADAVVISDMSMPSPKLPAITYALRGALSMELEVRRVGNDLHSGIFGGAVPNPLEVLCKMISQCHDRYGRIDIPGFYERVRKWSDTELEYMARTGPSDAEVLENAQAQARWGEAGYTLYERTTIRPSLTVHGIVGGYQGPGSKSVIPAKAVAKLSFRLVPDQHPAEIEQLFRDYVARITPKGTVATIRTFLTASHALVDRHHPVIRVAAEACRRGFGRHPVFLRSGGTIPVVNLFQRILGIPTVLMGFALPDDGFHAPNEKFHLPNFFHGIATSIHLLSELKGMKKKPESGPKWPAVSLV